MVCCITLVNVETMAQYRNLFLYNYSAGKAVGTLNDFIDKKYYDGFHIDLRHFFKDEYSLGFRIGWNNVKAVLDRQSFQTEKGTVSAIQTRYMSSLPVVLNAFYYPVKGKLLIPYAGGSLGLYVMDYQKWFGSVAFKNKSFRPGISPEIGFLAPIKKSEIGVGAFARFNYVVYSHEEVKNMIYLELGLSIFFGDKIGKEEVKCE
ncbi:hypothetical protein Odosp_0559 [Sporocytophaga myxococcoides]|uniref:Outer membrane protein beta-barrel domain-containing protein n=1 Tax=Sporocytophaga myxococcoides TaxID=153721 RepID=A0A098LP10_9BACT|nr:hypothetical protein [Sporocytophaga myxococcoides]GAL87728.1 hypothetical protein Odosp_0559 [Sporocytophaga myxococcoides]